MVSFYPGTVNSAKSEAPIAELLNYRLDNDNMITPIRNGVYVSMVNWQVTATTIYCDAVDDEVTLMVYKDWSASCVGYSKYGEPGKEIVELLKDKSKKLRRHLACEGLECIRVIQYKDKLLAEEAEKGDSEQKAEGVVAPIQEDGGSQQ